MRDRGIIVQIKMWDRFDHSGDPWQDDPFNPKNKINYDEDESGLAPDYHNTRVKTSGPSSTPCWGSRATRLF